MAYKFKREELSFDLDLEIPLINGKEEVIKCVKNMSGNTYNEFVVFCKSVFATSDEVQLAAKSDPTATLNGIVKQIDWLYQKGETWWKENVAPEIILAISGRLGEYVKYLGKKKAD